MGEEIKSALELALERTADIKSDKSKLEEHDNLQKGKRLASKYLHPIEDEDKIDLEGELKKYTGKDLQHIRRGIFDVILSNISLPAEEVDTTLMNRIEEALEILVKNKKKVSSIFQQINQFFGQYLDNREQIRAGLEQQFAPRLREKAAALSQKMGSQVHLEAAADPEFVEYLRRNYSQLDEQFQEALSQMKDQIRGMFSRSVEG